jgi:chromosomal replication initiation ATPase DnaA
MSKSENNSAYIYTELLDARKDDFVQRIQKRNPKDIIQAVCETVNLTEAALKSNLRKREVVEARYIAIILILNANPDLTLKQVGHMFNREHSTVIYARDTYYQLIVCDKNFQDKVASVKQKV